MRRFHVPFRRGDLILIGAVLLAGVIAALLLWLFPGGRGTAAVIRTPTETRRISLDTDTSFSVSGAGGHTVTVTVSGGKVRFSEADCPDRYCVSAGWLSHAGQTAACVPSGITLTVEGGDAAYDTVTQ